MLEALILTLREGVEAALMVGIIVAFLRKEERGRHLPAVWTGLAVALAASVAGALMLYRVAVNEEAFEGLLYLASAVMVGTLVIWMWRHSRVVAGQMRSSLARILERDRAWAATAGLFTFTFLMVFREGVETALFLSALSLTTRGFLAFLGAALGLALAVAFGVLFVRGSVRIDLGRFFKITGIALMIFVVQLLLNAYHELSEAGWAPATPGTMAVVGPLVRNEFFFMAAVIALPLLMLLIPGRKGTAEPPVAAQGAAARLQRAQELRQRRLRFAAGTLGLAVLGLLSFGFAYSQPAQQLSPATSVSFDSSGHLRLPASMFDDGDLHRFVVSIDGRDVRFIAIRVGDGRVATALDACEICGTRGYVQDGATIACLHCHSAIYPPSIGQTGGCNPIPLESEIVDGEVVLAAAELERFAGRFDAGAEAGHAGSRGAHGAHGTGR